MGRKIAYVLRLLSGACGRAGKTASHNVGLWCVEIYNLVLNGIINGRMRYFRHLGRVTTNLFSLRFAHFFFISFRLLFPFLAPDSDISIQ
jgi:hypothetical protein